MARRKVEEINAGSMADIAFLLLIFFLVTTTMEVDAGISRNLPYKRDPNEKQLDPPKINDRDILVIMANSNDQLLVEGEYMELENLEEKVREFFTANKSGQLNAEGEISNNEKMPTYKPVNANICNQMINEWKAKQAAAPEIERNLYDPEIDKWKAKLVTLDVIKRSSYNEISNQALIQLKNQAGTTYGLYVEIQNILKKVVNDLRDEYCKEFGWPPYKDLDVKEESDREKLAALQVLVPERIIEAKIEQ